MPRLLTGNRRGKALKGRVRANGVAISKHENHSNYERSVRAVRFAGKDTGKIAIFSAQPIGTLRRFNAKNLTNFEV